MGVPSAKAGLVRRTFPGAWRSGRAQARVSCPARLWRSRTPRGLGMGRVFRGGDQHVPGCVTGSGGADCGADDPPDPAQKTTAWPGSGARWGIGGPGQVRSAVPTELVVRADGQTGAAEARERDVLVHEGSLLGGAPGRAGPARCQAGAGGVVRVWATSRGRGRRGVRPRAGVASVSTPAGERCPVRVGGAYGVLRGRRHPGSPPRAGPASGRRHCGH